MEINYYKEEDIMHIVISEGPERGSAEINPNITLLVLTDSVVKIAIPQENWQQAAG